MEKLTVSRVTLINFTILVESILLLAATGWARFGDVPLLTNMRADWRQILIGVGAGVVMALGAYLLFAVSRKDGFLSPLREIVENVLQPLFAECNVFDVFLLAAVSGFCEEIFFRGVVQAKFGLWWASVVFGLFHDPSLKYAIYSVMAFLYGLILGALYVYTGSLWTPICAHAVHNLISLYILRYHVKPPAATAGAG